MPTDPKKNGNGNGNHNGNGNKKPWTLTDDMLGYTGELSEWDRGYLCVKCRGGFYRYYGFPRAAERRLCACCYVEVQWNEELHLYPTIPIPSSQDCRNRGNNHHYRNGHRCIDCGTPITGQKKSGKCHSCAQRKKPKTNLKKPLGQTTLDVV